MTILSCRTRGDSDPRGKPRVFFTCHPDDFERYFDIVCEEILEVCDCAIIYRENDSSDFSSNDELDMNSLSLLVIPISRFLLTESNQAMQSDFALARSNHIPVLPLMMEPGLLDIYHRPDRFGKTEYVNLFDDSKKIIKHNDKLKKYLEYTLFSDDLANRVRASFNGNIFLSYRKKDKIFVNKVMHAIHSIEDLYDFSIWYDEYLTPGEFYDCGIENAIEQCDVFVLLVTPSILENVNGEPNYIIREEYPKAKALGKMILPIEVVQTDRDLLQYSFSDLPEIIDVDDSRNIQRLIRSCSKCFGEPIFPHKHEYNIGLAYYHGIFVEHDRERGIKLIEKAANAGLESAMDRLFNMYLYGSGIPTNASEAVRWGEKLLKRQRKRNLYDWNQPGILDRVNRLADAYLEASRYRDALKLLKKSLPFNIKSIENGSLSGLEYLIKLAFAFQATGDIKNSLQYHKISYSMICKHLGENHIYALDALTNLSVALRSAGNYPDSLLFAIRAYKLSCRIYGNKDILTINVLNNLAIAYYVMGDYKRAYDYGTSALNTQIYDYDNNNRITAETLNLLSNASIALGNYNEALQYALKAYDMNEKLRGKQDTCTILVKITLANAYAQCGNVNYALQLANEVYSLNSKVQGYKHPDSLNALHSLAYFNNLNSNYKEGLKYAKRAYKIYCKEFGKDNGNTIKCLSVMAESFSNLGKLDRALDCSEKVYNYYYTNFGIKNTLTAESLKQMVVIFVKCVDKRLSLKNSKAIQYIKTASDNGNGFAQYAITVLTSRL